MENFCPKLLENSDTELKFFFCKGQKSEELEVKMHKKRHNVYSKIKYSSHFLLQSFFGWEFGI